MIYPNCLLNDSVVISLSHGVEETLLAMAQVTGIFEKSFMQDNWKSPCELSVYLEIESLPAKGQIRFHFSQQVLCELYKKMMNEEAAPSLDEVVDCLGEFSNVCYGAAKSKLNRVGYSLGMALPHPGKTDDLPNVSSSYPHIVIPFKIFNEICYIQIVIL